MNSKNKFKSQKSNLIFLLIISLVLFFIFFILFFINLKLEKKQNNNSNITSNISQSTNSVDSVITNDEWNISIPKILIYSAPVKDGIDEDTLNNYIGHFPSTNKERGNVGFAAHNRGYKNNYFKDINKLNIGDEIIYKNKDYLKIYKVELKEEIDSYDWSYLEATTSDKITLITCVSNKPNKRLVVQGSI